MHQSGSPDVPSVGYTYPDKVEQHFQVSKMKWFIHRVSFVELHNTVWLTGRRRCACLHTTRYNSSHDVTFPVTSRSIAEFSVVSE